jgi:hypothetical protein
MICIFQSIHLFILVFVHEVEKYRVRVSYTQNLSTFCILRNLSSLLILSKLLLDYYLGYGVKG